jgi:hypothetical protein
MVAKKIIELGQRGIRQPEQLQEQAIRELTVNAQPLLPGACRAGPRQE